MRIDTCVCLLCLTEKTIDIFHNYYNSLIYYFNNLNGIRYLSYWNRNWVSIYIINLNRGTTCKVGIMKGSTSKNIIVQKTIKT